MNKALTLSQNSQMYFIVALIVISKPFEPGQCTAPRQSLCKGGL